MSLTELSNVRKENHSVIPRRIKIETSYRSQKKGPLVIETHFFLIFCK